MLGSTHCHARDIRRSQQVGLYYSPAQFGSKEMDSREYDDYFVNQISELLQNYGKIAYLWFDGCGSEGHEYDTQRIIKEIRRMQPNILIFNMWDPDTGWAGNEMGSFLPAECDCRMRESWF